MTFDLQPLLRGELITLRPLTAGDFAELLTVASDPLIWEQHPSRDRYQQTVFQKFFDESLRSGGAVVVCDAGSGCIIGASRYRAFGEARSEVEIGWTFLARAYWGGRYNGELKRLMLEHAFRFVSRVVFLVGPSNVRSQRAMEKVGGVRAGTGKDTSGRECIVYEIKAGTYKPS